MAPNYGSIKSVIAKEISVNAFFKILLKTIEIKISEFERFCIRYSLTFEKTESSPSQRIDVFRQSTSEKIYSDCTCWATTQASFSAFMFCQS